MPRLLDDLRAAGRCQMPWFVQPHLIEKWDGYARRMAEILFSPDLPVLLIDNVADYYFTGTDPDVNERFFRIGVDPSGMVMPVGVNLEGRKQ